MTHPLKDPRNQKLLNDFVSEHAPLINKHVAILRSKGLVPKHIEDEDLHAAGFHGLMDALHKYDPAAGAKMASKEGENTFAKYAERRIQGKMLDHMASQDAVPKAARTKAKNIAANKSIIAAQQATPEQEPESAPTTPKPII